MALALKLLGGLEVSDHDGRPLEISAKKARALLAYLAVRPGRRHTREHVAALLWGDISADEHARRSLRQSLSVLRKLLPDGVLESGRDELGLAETDLGSDVRMFESALQCGDAESLRQAVALYRGDFLEGFSARADGFDDWATAERARLRQRALEAIEKLGRLERDAGRLDAAIGLAMRVVALEPLRESAHRDLMQLYAETGAPGRALKQYETCRKLLVRELGIDSSAATAELAARIRAADPVAQSPRPATADLPARDPTREAASGPALRQVVIVHVAATWDEAVRPREARDDARETLARSGGRMLRDTADGLTAVYGAAPARGNSLEHAVQAALSLRGQLAETSGRIGVAAGQALIEEIDGGLLVQGEVVSLASSLHQVGSLVISESIRTDLGERAEVSGRSRVRGAGAWELLALKAADAVPSALFGRDFELAQLVSSLAPCIATGRGRCYVVRGEPGIGKTRLVAHFCQQARQANFQVIRHHVLDFGRGAETNLLHALSRSLLLENPRDDAEAALTRALEQHGLAPSDLGFARQLIALEPGSAALDAGPEETARRRDEIVSKLILARARRQPLVIWIEDIHWAPPVTLLQLARLIPSVAESRALLVMTTRLVGEPDHAEWRRAVRGRAVSTLDLAPLDESAARALLESLRSRRGDSTGDAARIVARAEGNPLFLEQLAWTGAADAVPASVQALVQSRMDAIGQVSRRALEAASVLGQRVEARALGGVLGTPECDLTELVEHGLLQLEADGARFTHALLRDAVYASLTDERCRTLHLAAAAHYAERNALLRAGHLERAHDEAAPEAYWLAAAEERRCGGIHRALELCDRALTLATHDADLRRANLLRGEILRELGMAEEALAAFSAARQYSRDVEERAQAWLGTASVLRLLDRRGQALEALSQAGSALDPAAMPELSSHVHFMRGNVLFPSGDSAACLREHQRALELAEQARSPLAEAQALNGMADAHYVAGRMHAATRLFERCEGLAGREGFVHLERASRGMRLVIQVLFLRVREAAERCLEEAKVAEEAGALRAVPFLRTGGCLALGFLGEWERMANQAQAAAELTRRIGARRFEALALAYLGRARFHLGQEHRGELARALELALESGPAFSAGIVHAAFVESATDPELLRRELRRGLAALDAGAVAHGRIVFLTTAVAAATRLRDASEVQRLADELRRSCEEPCELVTLFAELGAAAAALLTAPDDPTHRLRLTALAERAAAAGLEPIRRQFAEL